MLCNAHRAESEVLRRPSRVVRRGMALQPVRTSPPGRAAGAGRAKEQQQVWWSVGRAVESLPAAIRKVAGRHGIPSLPASSWGRGGTQGAVVRVRHGPSAASRPSARRWQRQRQQRRDCQAVILGHRLIQLLIRGNLVDCNLDLAS